MKKLFTLFAGLCCAVASFATDYTDSLEIFGGAVTTPVKVPATITVNQNEDGTLSFTLKNFMLQAGNQTMYIGNVALDGVPTQDGLNGRTFFCKSADTQIEDGDDKTKMWMGPMLGPVAVVVYGYLLPDNHIYTRMAIQAMGMDIRCSFGRGFDFMNGGFENYHTATVGMAGMTASSDEPDYWHSFMSASGNPALVYMAGYNPHTFISNVTRPGTAGRHSLMLTSLDMWIAIANGTVTTGRINAGSPEATDKTNNAWLALDSTGVDAKGDPYYQYMNGRPDSLVAWVKFIQGTPNAQHPYATISAAITDGSYYQEPADKDYTNIFALARNNKIETKSGDWQRLAIPFDYDSYKNNQVNGRAILATISTNADAGKGSTDTLYVDDIQMVYNNYVKSVTYNGQTFQATPDEDNEVDVTFTVNGSYDPSKVSFDVAPHSFVAYLGTEKDEDSGNPVASYAVFADDLSSVYDVEVTFAGGTTNGITSPSLILGQPAIYNLNGQRVDKMQHGQVYIIKQADGTTTKVLK